MSEFIFTDAVKRTIAEQHDRITALESENAKLHDLVDELWAIAYGYAPYESELDRARDMMRELGIEVSE